MFKNLPWILFVLAVVSILSHIWPHLVNSSAAAGLPLKTSKRLISPSELAPFSSQELRLLRNEIYARHGYVFEDQYLQDYFSSKPWYRPLGNNDLAKAKLTKTEIKNIETIKSQEEAKIAGPAPQPGWMGRWPGTSAYLLNPDDLLHLATPDLRLMRNEIYARHGYVFDDQYLQDYFSSQSWYRPRGDNNLAEAALNPVERRNIEIIRAREEANVAAPYPQSAWMGRWPETSIYSIRPDDLLNYSAPDLRLMRNEIYARHGRVFDDPSLQRYFSVQPWYRPRGDNSAAEAELSPVERHNIEIIRARETALDQKR
jgi:hypothetical protein